MQDNTPGKGASIRQRLRVAGRAVVDLAARLADAPWEARAILDLARRSAKERLHAFNWAGIYGSMRWGVSRRSADRLIHHLEELGHIEVVYRGDRHTPRRIRFHVIPLKVVDIKRLWKARLEVSRRWNGLKACAHRIYKAAPPVPSHCPFDLSDDPYPCFASQNTPDPLSESKPTDLFEPRSRSLHPPGNLIATIHPSTEAMQ